MLKLWKYISYKVFRTEERLDVYHKQTQPLIDYYDNEKILASVDGTKDMEEVFLDIIAVLG